VAIADRKDECILFDRLMAGQLGARILLIEGTGERGKSTLLGEFARRVRADWGVDACAVLELKQGVPLRQICHSIYQQLGSQRCSRYVAARESLARRGVAVAADLSGATFGDANQISIGSQIILSDKNVDHDLAEALLEDLLFHPGPVLIILDTYDQATPESKKWLLGSVLPVVAKNERLFSVAGGRTIPQPNEYELSWSDIVATQTLATDISLDDWHEYARAMFPGFPRESLATVYLGLKDRPGSIRTYIHNAGKILVDPRTT
jgi:hypothetical protein